MVKALANKKTLQTIIYLLIGFFSYKFLFGRNKDSSETSLAEAFKKAQGGTLDRPVALAYANTLYDAMSDLGTNNHVVVDTLKKIPGNAEFWQVYYEHGERYYNSYGGSLGFSKSGLLTIMEAEYSNESKASKKKVNDQFKRLTVNFKV